MVVEVRMKGTNFRGTLGALERLHGKPAVERALSIVPGPAAEALRNGEVVTGGWYPAAWYRAFLEGIERSIPDRPELLRELSREAVRYDLATIFKVLSFFISPERALDNATKIMARYYDGGKIAVEETRSDYLRFRFDEYHGLDRRLWEDIVGGMEGVLMSMRVNSPRGRVVSGGGDGDAFMIAELTWVP
jgi:hypothetical protein